MSSLFTWALSQSKVLLRRHWTLPEIKVGVAFGVRLQIPSQSASTCSDFMLCVLAFLHFSFWLAERLAKRPSFFVYSDNWFSYTPRTATNIAFSKSNLLLEMPIDRAFSKTTSFTSGSITSPPKTFTPPSITVWGSSAHFSNWPFENTITDSIEKCASSFW